MAAEYVFCPVHCLSTNDLSGWCVSQIMHFDLDHWRCCVLTPVPSRVSRQNADFVQCFIMQKKFVQHIIMQCFSLEYSMLEYDF